MSKPNKFNYNGDSKILKYIQTCVNWLLDNDSGVQSDYAQTDTTAPDYIKNKPTLGTASAKDFTTSVTQNSNDLVTGGAVFTAIDNLPKPMIFKGTLGTNGTITILPSASTLNEGYTYKVITAGTYASQPAKVGDVFTSNGTEWVLIPAGDESDTDTWRGVNVNGTQLLGNGISSGNVNFKSGTNAQVSGSGNDITVDVSTTFTEASTRTNIASGDTIATIFGKIKKWFTDIVNNSIAFHDVDDSTIAIGYPSVGSNPMLYSKCSRVYYDSTNKQLEITTKSGASATGVDIVPIPTKTSDLTNDSGYVTTDTTYTADGKFLKLSNNVFTKQIFSSSQQSSAYWYKICECSITTRYAWWGFDIEIRGEGRADAESPYIRLICRGKQQNAMTSDCYYKLKTIAWSGYTPSNCRLYVTSNTSSLKKVELWVNNPTAYQELHTIINDYAGSGTINWTWTRATNTPDYNYVSCIAEGYVKYADIADKVTQTDTTSSAEYRVLLSGDADDTTQTAGVRKSTGLRYNPYSGTLKVPDISLNGSEIKAPTYGDISDIATFNTNVTKNGLCEYTTCGNFAKPTITLNADLYITTTPTMGAYFTLFTLKTNYRPSNTVYFVACNQSMTSIVLGRIIYTGEVQLYFVSGSNIGPYAAGVRFSVTYIS